MTALEQIRSGFAAWLDALAATVANLCDRLAHPRTVRVVQTSPHQFELKMDVNAGASFSAPFKLGTELQSALPASVTAALSGSRVELVLPPDLFLFRPMELPNRATEFLQGIIRAQIDRLTPWSAEAAAFGWSKPIASGSDRMVVTIAVTAQALIEPYRAALTKLGAHSLAILTTPPDADAPITVIDVRARGLFETSWVRKALVNVLMCCCFAAGITLGAAAIADFSLELRQSGVTRQLAQLRADASSAQQMVERRKLQTPATVVLLDALSDILPDHTYVTELRIESNKVRLTGVSRDAASLIGLIEKSGRFTRANFFAPTTSSDGTERFHIEAVIQATVAVRS